MNRFTMANDSDIMNGSVTDVYFEKTMEYLTMLKRNPSRGVSSSAKSKYFPDILKKGRGIPFMSLGFNTVPSGIAYTFSE